MTGQDHRSTRKSNFGFYEHWLFVYLYNYLVKILKCKYM